MRPLRIALRLALIQILESARKRAMYVVVLTTTVWPLLDPTDIALPAGGGSR